MTWSPEEFEPLIPPTVKLEELKFPESPVKGDDNIFSVPKAFWDDLWKDPILSVEFEKFLAERVKSQVNAVLEKEKANASALGFQKGKEEGFEVGKSEGFESAYREVKNAEPLLQTIVQEIILKKELLIREHEKEWAQALVHTIHKLQVKEPELFANGIKKWVSDRLMDFPNYTKVRVFVGKQDFEKIDLIIKNEDFKNCEVLMDGMLEGGQVRCDCGEGGVFFSKVEGFKILDSYLEENF